jgi:hypothetical protein
MKKRERILSFKMSQKLSASDIEGVAAAGMTSYMTANGTYDSRSGWDSCVDFTVDL